VRIAIASEFGCSISWAARLQDEGCDVLLYINGGHGRQRGDDIIHVGEGIVEKEQNYERFIEWASEGQYSLDPTLVLFDASGMGARADEARKLGLHVIGGGSFMDKLEQHRDFGFKVAQDAGCELPPYEQFNSLAAVQSWAESIGDTACYFKTDKFIGADIGTYGAKNGEGLARHMAALRKTTPDRLKCIVQKKIEGVALSTGRWWNGSRWTGPYEFTIEKKKFMNGEIGPSTGCSLNAVWYWEDPKIAEALGWENLASEFRRYEASAGLYDINAVIAEDGKPYFLEWTPRLGYDSEMTSGRLCDSLSDMLWNIATDQGTSVLSTDLAYAFRISTEPYPWEHSDWADKHSCVGEPIHGVDGLWDGNFIAYQLRVMDDVLQVASPEGIVGLSLATGDSLPKLHEEALEFAKSLEPGSLQFRTDGDKAIARDAQELKDAGFESLHTGLLKGETP
jgi:phosphoribosylamine-glycine ligase